MQNHSRHPLKKIVVIVGPTASGKTSLAIEMAKQFDGEVISADSRQVYRGLDIGTDKVTEAEMQGIPHHLIDIADPDTTYTASDFLEDADKAIVDISSRGKLTIVAGGTFFYIDTLLGLRILAGIAPNATLRAELETVSTDELYRRLYALDPNASERIDRHNSRRLVRALEVITGRGDMPAVTPQQRYKACILGIDVPIDVLRKRINTRLDATLERGLIAETKQLLAEGMSLSRLTEIGLEYKIVLKYLNGEYSEPEMRTVLQQKVGQYAKRQLTWLKKMQNVHWISYDETSIAADIIQEFVHSPDKN